uniref:Uncharacterized protein n=1 Tax=Ciona savignyi TaxID=51511 RepID=H2Z725_CIOSA
MFRAPEDDDRVSSLVQSVLEVVTIAADDDCHRSQKTLDDCVTENEAWKTSLRIGNIWQSISGIRPVDIVYSEKQTSSEGEALLQPSSLTHFRPIDAWTEPDSDTTTSSSYNENTSFTPVEHIADEYIEFSSPQKNAQNHSNENIITERSNFRPKFRKLGEDKCLQTSFHEQMRYREGKPPKANSR